MEENDNKKYSVYKHTSPEGNVYIGCTSEKPEVRWSKQYRHNREFSDDIKKFGWDKFQHEIVSADMNEEDAYVLEKELIHKYKEVNQNLIYNKSLGGKGNPGFHHKHIEEAKRKIREAGIGRHHTEETKRKLSEARLGEGNPMYGKHPSEETRKKLSEARRRHRHSEDTKRKIGEAHHKKVMCIETKKIYESITQASLEFGCSISSITMACTGVNKTACGYHWTYVL